MQSSSCYIQKKYIKYNNQFTFLVPVQMTANNILNSDREMNWCKEVCL